MKKCLCLLLLISAVAACNTGISRQSPIVLPTSTSDTTAQATQPTLARIAQSSPVATPTPIATITPTCTAAPTPPPTNGPVKYYWPPSLSPNFKIMPCSSTVDERGFHLEARSGGGAQWVSLTFSGGTGIHFGTYLPPCGANYRAVTIHGQPGCASVDNNTRSIRIFWQEDNTVYSIDSAGLSLEETLAIGEASQTLNHDAFQQDLAFYVTPTPNPSGPLVYYWPSEIPVGFVISAEQSSVDDNGFVLALKSLENDGRDGMIWGGSKARLDEACDVTLKPGIVRGRSGYLGMGTGAGFGVAWRENGHPYVIGGIGMSSQDVQMIADTLEPVDQVTWQQRLARER
jgi:hypothetical protein